MVNIPFSNSYLHVADALFSPQLPTPVKEPGLIRVNQPLAEALLINPSELMSEEGVAVLAGNQIPSGAEPIATAYAGHQFGGWNPQLGDGRAILLGEVIGKDNHRYDIQLKGAGPTPYSRMGDGRSPIGPVLREYIVSEAMAAMGVPTTRSLAAVTTGEGVFRQGMLPGAILTRVASSHIRVGTFQYFAMKGDIALLTALADHVIDRHYPAAKTADNPYAELLNGVIERQAKLIAKWMSVGFIHGVMNTDNMLVCGETVDYGPCAFMDTYRAETVYSSIDHGGRYAYKNQPYIAQWNLAQLAQSLLPLLADNETDSVNLAQQAVDSFVAIYQAAYDEVVHNKLGFAEISGDTKALIPQLLALMTEHKVDFTLGFRALADTAYVAYAGQAGAGNPQSVADLYQLPAEMSDWVERWLALLNAEMKTHPKADKAGQALMYASNPVFIPRNHLIEQVIVAATQSGDLTPFHTMVDLLVNPYDFNPEKSQFAIPPRPDQVVLQTFCGT
ncbi:MAG: YdiU family protein [Pseudomonadales bacterium]|nr:YdiU family protein [Pseudomonadales bacterium]MCP5301545.1 YdiU family protein [Pseudomonadales bacterium]